MIDGIACKYMQTDIHNQKKPAEKMQRRILVILLLNLGIILFG